MVRRDPRNLDWSRLIAGAAEVPNSAAVRVVVYVRTIVASLGEVRQGRASDRSPTTLRGHASLFGRHVHSTL